MITIISPTWKQLDGRLQSFVYSVISQDDPRWKLIVAHDGPSEDGTRVFMHNLDWETGRKDKVKYFESAERKHNPAENHGWGHYLRAEMLAMVDTKWVWFQNGDNQICHAAIKHLLAPDDRGDDYDVIMFKTSHSYFGYKAFGDYFGVNGCDLAQFIIKTDIAKAVGFNHRDFAADGWFIEDVKRAYPNLKIHYTDGVYTTHN